MNIMRKLLVGHSRTTQEDPQHTALGLMHLKKLFSEYCHPLQSLSQKEQEDKLYNMLPLFCKVFGNSPAKDMIEKFPDILPFCQQVSKLMVSEIRRRASNQSTEAASCAIVKFLEIESTEESSSGWMLLTTINLLAAGDPSLIEVMTASSLPSTLVKCLYLFFDLPEVENANIQDSDSEFTPRERRILLQKIFVQVLVRLCTHIAPAEELARKDDLTLLFSAITSWCPQHNVPWRKSAAEVLMTLSRHCLSPQVVSYIHNKGCVAHCIDNMQRVPELSPLEIVEMLVTVFCFLKDSTEVSQTLLDDFRSCQGYIFLSEFLLRLELNAAEESQEALRNLVFLVASLSMCGYIELKPSQASSGSLFQMQGFHIPQPSGRGVSVRNIQAFQVLQSAFLKASSTHLCLFILDAISGVYHSDTANYFILEPQHTLSQFAEKIHLKPTEVQVKFFQILEFIVHHLCFVPCKELISLSILLKTQSSVECSITCMKTLLSILKHDYIFKDVYREVGLLEVMVTCLHRYAGLLKETHSTDEDGPKEIGKVPENLQTLGFLVMEALTALLSNNNSNAGVFRECGGARCAHNLVPYPICRHQALGIVQQLVLCNGGDDDMGTLLGMMHSAPVLALEFKTDILKALLHVLRESHRTRTVFRKVGGFVYVMSGLVSMEGCLADPPKPPWDTVNQKQVLTLLKMVFNTLTVAMRFEPANAKFFAQEICYTSLTDTIRLLGCFSNDLLLDAHVDSFNPLEENTLHVIFTSSKEDGFPLGSIPRTLALACLILRLLYDMALDAFDRPGLANQTTPKSPSLKHPLASEAAKSVAASSPPANKRHNLAHLNLMPAAPDPVVVHPVIVVAILHLLPSIKHNVEKQIAMTLQLYTAEVLKSLVRSERNQQVMCDAGLPHELLNRCSIALEDECHPLHGPLQYMLERLAAQALEPKDLRDFLRLTHPLCCKPFDSWKSETMDSNGNTSWPANKREGGPVPLTRVKTLVSMTTPRDFRVNGASLTPPFVEFDMSNEGFGCLYLPSIAPQSVSGPTVVGVGMVSGGDTSVLGGVGSGDRLFPPQTGLTYSTWICVEKFSDPRNDPHSVCLMSLIRHVHTKDDHLLCLNVLLSARDKALIISTQETSLSQAVSADWEPEVIGDGCIRIWCPELIQEGQWHHLVLVLNRAVLKNSSMSLYINGQHIKTQRLHYISQNPGGGAANLTVASSVYGYIGTPPSRRRHSRLTWKQGPCHLLEDVFSAQTINTVFRLGPSYMGSLQAPILNGNEVLSPLVPEDKLILGLNAIAMSGLTLARIRKVYSKIDSKAIAKQLGMSSHENATPIYILHNSAGHLAGPARSLGGVLIGYLGARTFSPRPVARMIENVGGCYALLGLIAMANDVEGLYAAVKALVCIVRSNKAAQLEMDRIRGYQTLAMLLKKKRLLLNSHILHLTFSLVGTVDSGRENTVIPNTTSFLDLLCDLEIWHEAPGDLQRSLYEHFHELLTESSEQRVNLKLMRNLGMVPKLLHILKDSTLSLATTQVINNLLGVLLYNTPNSSDLLRFGQFVASTLPTCSSSEKNLSLEEMQDKKNGNDDDPPDSAGITISVQSILLRNRCLKLLFSLFQGANNTINHAFCEEVVRTLGFDWLMLFLQGHIHSTTVISALRILLLMLSNPNIVQRFREGCCNGGWLQDTEPVLENRMGVVLGFNVGTASTKLPLNRDVKEDAFHVPGFQMLQMLLPKHIHTPELYFLLLALLLGQPVKHLPCNLQLNLDSIWSFLFGVPSNKTTSGLTGRVEICPDVVLVILAMIRTMLNQPIDDDIPWLKEYPVTLIQFLLYLYHNTPEFVPVCMTGEILCGLASTLFIYKSSSENNSEVVSPVDDFRPYPGADPVVLVKTHEKLSTAGSLFTNHPARKFVIDFLRVIVVDSLSFPVTSKSPPVIDLLLEAAPEQSSQLQQCEFQTEILVSLMDHLLAADVLLGEQAALPIVAGGSYSYIAANVFYLASRIVDKLWQGIFSRDPHEVFDFLVKLINQAKRRSASLSLEPLYHCLNRTILHQLSRPTDTVADQMAVLEALHKLTSNRTIVFGPNNYELEFIGCLCYCLLQLTEEFTVSTDTNRKTTWHFNPGAGACQENFPTAQDGQGLLVTAARRVWEELYVCKKPSIEEVFKVNFPSLNKTPDLKMLRDMIYESASKIWLTYIESEKKSSYKASWELQSQLQQVVNFSGLQKLQKVTGGLTRLASRRARREESIKFKMANVSFHDIQLWTFNHISIVLDLVELQYKQYQQSHLHMQKYVFEDWLQAEDELTRERGIWGPPVGSKLDKWMLDMTEGPCRMRKKMMKNGTFYLHYPYRPELENGENKSLKYKAAMSYDSKKYYQCQRSAGMVEREIVPFEANTISTEELQTDVDISDVMREIGFQGLRSGLLSRPSLNRNTSEPEDDSESLEPNSDTNTDQDGGDKPDNQTLLRLLDEGEKISHMFRCARIQGLDTSEGLLLFGKEHFYVVDGFTLLKTREIKDIDYLPANMYDPIIPNSSNYRSKRDMKKLCSKFAYDDVREVHKRRYLLQPIALEVFSADGRNYLLAFPRGIRNKVYQRFMVVATAINDNAQQSVAGQKRTANVEQSASLLSSLIGETSVTHRWVREEISNFQYLMHLNTLAGRSYNDLMQYPVFPWILADYENEDLDFNDPATFRDFSKPMGAQSPERLKQFKKRYREWDDPHGETPPYHYGTHYSSAMIVASYLVRMEPFAQHFLRLQGGHFDLADRMFHSIKEAWLSASKHNMADVKELIPEFFYLPEFLSNSNNFDLGCKQNGVQLNDVILPPWAKGDVREFIRVHRQALECDFVSAHLHEWIDLIFGYKQHGQAAVEATNVFHHLFYEGNVDIYSIDDPLKKNATIGFINNFGQIPKQLFKKPHPAKKLNHRTSLIDPMPLTPTISCSPDKLFFHNLDNLKPSMTPIKELKGPVGQIIHNDKAVLAVEQNKVLVPPTYTRYLAWGFADQSLRLGNYESEKANFVYEMTQYGEVLCSACPNSKIVITAGTSTVVNVWEFNKKQLTLKQSLYGHTETVTCVAASPSYNLIVSGSRDRTCILWDMSRLIFVRQLTLHPAPVAAVAINELTGDIATCAGTHLYLWSINGHEIASVNMATGRSDRLQQILCVAFSQIYEWDPLNVIMTGSSDGVVRMWSTDYVQVPVEDEKKKSLEVLDDASARSSGVASVLSKLPSPSGDDSSQELTPESRIQEYVRRLSLAGNQEGKESGDIYCWVKGNISPPPGNLAKSGSESSLSDEDGAASLPLSSHNHSDNGSVNSRAPCPPPRKRHKSPRKTGKVENSSSNDDSSHLVAAQVGTSSSEDSVSLQSAVDKNGAGNGSPLVSCDSDLSVPEASLNKSAANGGPTGSIPDIEINLDNGSSCSNVVMDSGTIGAEKSCVVRRKNGTGGLAVANHIHRSSTIITSDNTEDGRGNNIRISKSDTSLSESFVMITESDISEAEKISELAVKKHPKLSPNSLREGFKWQCQLVFRSKLTMHTAYDRKDNTDPAAITALAISKDHKTVYVGDAKGRVFSWSVTDYPGRVMADHWVRDEGVDSCMACSIKFTFSERRHHCRNCGQLFCSRCSRFESEINRLRILKPVRVCQNCYTTLKMQHHHHQQQQHLAENVT